MNLLTRFTGRHAKWEFEASELKEYTGFIKNPARGWYQIHTFRIEDEPDLGELEWCIDRNDALAMIVIDIGSSRDRDLNDVESARIRKILSFFADYKYDVILRVVYDHEGKALEREPFFFAQVRSHMEQIGGLIGEFDNTLFVYQGFLIGNWGEMHSSKFLSEDQMEELAEILRRRKGNRTFLAVRKPMHWRMLHRKSEQLDRAPEDKMGLFDDGIFGSEGNLGTFGDRPEAEAGWTNPWVREDELAFEEKICRDAPNGGEVVSGGDYTDRLNVDDFILTLRRMHVTYLNRLHDMKLIDRWKQTKMSVTGAWKGRSVYDYIGAHLGYRFFIRKVNVVSGGGYNANLCRIDIEIENRGFANLYEEAELSLKWTNYLGKYDTRIFQIDMRGWDSGRTYTVSCTIEMCDSPLYISAKRKSDGARIYFANTSDEEGRVMLGLLQLKQSL